VLYACPTCICDDRIQCIYKFIQIANWTQSGKKCSYILNAAGKARLAEGFCRILPSGWGCSSSLKKKSPLETNERAF
jgi:hypothetical protein